METNSNILSYDILSEMEQLQICGGQIGNPDNPDDINYYCNNAKCSQCSCLNPIKAIVAGCTTNVYCNTESCT